MTNNFATKEFNNLMFFHQKCPGYCVEPIALLSLKSCVEGGVFCGRLRSSSDPHDIDVIVDRKLLGNDFFESAVCSGNDETSCGILMEKGLSNLKQIIQRRSKLEWEDKLAICRRIVSIVAFMHSHNHVIMDLKLESFCRFAKGTEYEIRMIDLANMVDLSVENTLNEIKHLSVDTMAPECRDGCTLATSIDMWALGMIIFEVFVGETYWEVFPGCDVTDILNKSFDQKPEFLCLKNALVECLKVEPQLRITANELLDNALFTNEQSVGFEVLQNESTDQNIETQIMGRLKDEIEKAFEINSTTNKKTKSSAAKSVLEAIDYFSVDFQGSAMASLESFPINLSIGCVERFTSLQDSVVPVSCSVGIKNTSVNSKILEKQLQGFIDEDVDLVHVNSDDQKLQDTVTVDVKAVPKQTTMFSMFENTVNAVIRVPRSLLFSSSASMESSETTLSKQDIARSELIRTFNDANCSNK